MIAEFVLAVSLTGLPQDMKYVGHFMSQEQCVEYVDRHYDDKADARCLHEINMYLPKNVKKRVISVHDNCKIERTCNGKR